MIPRKLNIVVATFPYAGNGCSQAEHPDTRDWMLDVLHKATRDNRINDISFPRYADTPITLTRNKAVLDARKSGADVLIMIDSDMKPDCELKEDKQAKPFFETAFDFIYTHWEKGPVVVAAPYCGAPPVENVFAFRWRGRMNETQNPGFSLEAYTREEAAIMSGLQPAAAGATGLIAYDMRIFDLIEPEDEERADLSKARDHAHKGFFYYEWNDKYAAEKGSTEDVATTRDIAMIGLQKLGYNPFFIAWDSWAAHWKPHAVRKPRMITPECVGKAYRDGINRLPTTTKLINVESSVPEEYIAAHLVSDAEDFANLPDAAITQFLPPPRMWDHDETPPGRTPQRRTGASISWADCQSLQTLVRRVVERHPDRPIKIVEVGSWCGESALAMESMFGSQGGTVYCVDTWEGSPNDATSDVKRLYSEAMGADAIFKKFLHNTGHKNDRIIPVRGDSTVVASGFRDRTGETEPIDLIFLDAGHGYLDVKGDIQAWLPFLAEDGIMCGHDFGNLFPGVVYAVDEAFQKVEVAGLIWAHDRAREDLHATNGELQEA